MQWLYMLYTHINQFFCSSFPNLTFNIAMTLYPKHPSVKVAAYAKDVLAFILQVGVQPIFGGGNELVVNTVTQSSLCRG